MMMMMMMSTGTISRTKIQNVSMQATYASWHHNLLPARHLIAGASLFGRVTPYKSRHCAVANSDTHHSMPHPIPKLPIRLLDSKVLDTLKSFGNFDSETFYVAARYIGGAFHNSAIGCRQKVCFENVWWIHQTFYVRNFVSETFLVYPRLKLFWVTKFVHLPTKSARFRSNWISGGFRWRDGEQTSFYLSTLVHNKRTAKMAEKHVDLHHEGYFDPFDPTISGSPSSKFEAEFRRSMKMMSLSQLLICCIREWQPTDGPITVTTRLNKLL